MRIGHIYFKIALNYWKRHKIRTLVALISIAVGSCAVFCAGLLIRSEKQAELDYLLDISGDYEAIIYDVTPIQREQILKINGITEGGSYLNLGYTGESIDDCVRFACFPDDTSCKLYHMSCIRGSYPKRSGEIAIDINTATKMGVMPMPGESVILNMYDLDGVLVTTSEFKISGVFEATNEVVVGGWNRYPYQYYDYGEYKMPGVFISKEDAGLFVDKSDSTVFVVFDKNDSELIASLKEISGDTGKFILNSGRSNAYSNILGILDILLSEDDITTIQGVIDAISDGRVVKDFYSGVLVPVFNCLIAIMVFLSVYSISKNVVNDRRKLTGILRSLGFSAADSAWLLFAELFVFSLFSTFVGCLFGLFLHMGIVEFANRVFSQNLIYGFRVSEYVKDATFNPFVLSLIVSMLAVVVACIVPLIRFAIFTPSELLNSAEDLRSPCHIRRRSLKHNWLTVVNSRISFHSGAVMLMMTIVLSSALFGYLYFRALSDKANQEYRYELTECGLDNYDYYAAKKDTGMGLFNVETHHDYGVDQQAVDRLAQSEFTESVRAQICVRSTNLVIPKSTVNDEIRELLDGRNLRVDYSSDDHPTEHMEAQEAALRASGYSSDEELFSIQCIGLPYEEILLFNDYIVEGRLIDDELRSGESVILVVPADKVDLCIRVFGVGKRLPLSSITTDDFEDTIDCNGKDQLLLPHVYDTDLIYEDGSSVNLYSVHFGDRKDITTKVGAIISPDEETLAKLGILDNSGLYVITLAEAFKSWGLRDVKYTKVALKLIENCNVNEADAFWYETINGSKGVDIRSAFSINSKIYGTYIKTMLVYYLIVALLILCGIISICLSLYTKIEIKRSQIGILRMLGMSSPQMSLMLITQNIFYPFIAALIAIMPVVLCQSLFNYIKKGLENGTFEAIYEIEDGANMPWYHNIPFRYDLFSYNFACVFAVLIVAGIIMIIIGTMPQLIYIRRRKLIRK